MDPLTVALLGAAGYWVFKAIFGDDHECASVRIGDQHPGQKRGEVARDVDEPGSVVSSTMHPVTQESPYSATGVRRRASEPRRQTYGSVEECLRAEYVSYTRLRTYTSCPHRFRLQYLEGNEEDLTFSRAQAGKDFHRACENVLNRFLNEPISSLAVADQAPWRSDDRRRFSFIRRSIHASAQLVAVEHELKFNLRGLDFFGIVDLVVRDPDGVTHLIDIKTGRSPRIHLEQLEVYCLPILAANAVNLVRLSFLLVDSQERVTWEVGAGERECIVSNLFRIVDNMMRDRGLPPRLSSRCADCGFRAPCRFARSGDTITPIAWPMLTSAKRGLARRTAEVERARRLGTRKVRPKGSGALTFFVVIARRPYVCEQTGKRIGVGERHYATKRGCRLSVEGFRLRFPGCPLPTQTKKQRYPRCS